MFFIFYKFLFFVSDFLEIQRKSFYEFLNNKLGQEFLKIQPLVNSRKLAPRQIMSPRISGVKRFQKGDKTSRMSSQKKRIAIFFLFKNYKFLRPKLNIQESIFFKKTYCSHFYFPVQFVDHQKNSSSVQWIWMGTLPLLTRRGHFIINGTPRIVLNQIVRKPGIYFQKEIRKNIQFFYAEILSKRGPWVRLEIDAKQKVWISLQQKGIPRLEFFSFLKNFSRKNQDQALFLKKNEFFYLDKKFNIRTLNCCLHKMDSKYSFEQCVFKTKFCVSDSRKRNLFSTKKNNNRPAEILFASSSKQIDLTFNLSQTGRRRLNTQLGLGLTTHTLTPIDFLVIRDILFQLTQNSNTRLLDDIDDLQNRKINTIAELLQNQLERGLQRLQKNFERDSVQNNWSKSQFNHQNFQTPLLRMLNTQSINSTFKEFFHSHQLSQYLDQSNPLSEITHKRRLSCLGSGGVNRETAGMDIRGIHGTHYGRICPIETPEGKNAGLVNSLTTAVHVNPLGDLMTPFVQVYKQHIQNHKKFLFFSTQHQQKQNIFFNNKLPKLKNLSVGILKANSFQKSSLKALNFLSLTPQQFISIATTCIPFVEHNDANRALMGSNMQRQALPLVRQEQPHVTTFNACRVLSDLKDVPTSAHSGLILYTSKKKLSLLSLTRNFISIGKKETQNIFFLREKKIL
uniref:DNA-directed RNA polymerase n=1 Tax=Pseudocodium devriesii TaxID=453070 RepID=A0A386B0X5_9CHLO|nr:RNA polymerase b-subunit [Pseudocodium devriesii]AYC65351.1 RNA polymerase b-subunit [Pseudocodium devriesii]